MVLLLVLAIPLVNIVVLLVLAFGNPPSVGMKHYAQAALLWFAIGVGIVLLCSLVFGLSLGGLLSSIS